MTSHLLLVTPCEHGNTGHCDHLPTSSRAGACLRLDCNVLHAKPCPGGSETALDPAMVVRRVNDGWGHDYNLTVADVLTTLTAALQGDS